MTAIRCLARLPGADARCGRTELANQVAGSSHALDDGRLVAALVLRGVALRSGADPPETPG
ncbi:MAG: TIGR02679 domain-containing protein [Actinomycetota bacterium]|nr:TIGR02679 domain-containing protein [Actinomycetota bacterium]